MRGLLLEGPGWAATERYLDRDDLERAQAIMVCNALPGPLMARLIEGRPAHVPGQAFEPALDQHHPHQGAA